MVKEFNLSSKIVSGAPYGERPMFKLEDIKEFIKRLKDEIKHDIEQEDTWEGFEYSIDKLTGEKLT